MNEIDAFEERTPHVRPVLSCPVSVRSSHSQKSNESGHNNIDPRVSFSISHDDGEVGLHYVFKVNLADIS